MSERSPYRCPCCREALFVGRAQNVVLHACGGCRGVWLDEEDALRALRGFISEKALQLAARVDAGPSTAAEGYRTTTAEHGRRSCPHCGRELERKSIQAGRELLEIDGCRHGIWFDRSELAHIGRAALDAHDALSANRARALEKVALLSALEGEIETLSTSGDERVRQAAERLSDLADALRHHLLG
jgi:Zn-finger nucleic acid-binding protein